MREARSARRCSCAGGARATTRASRPRSRCGPPFATSWRRAATSDATISPSPRTTSASAPCRPPSVLRRRGAVVRAALLRLRARRHHARGAARSLGGVARLLLEGARRKARHAALPPRPRGTRIRAAAAVDARTPPRSSCIPRTARRSSRRRTRSRAPGGGTSCARSRATPTGRTSRSPVFGAGGAQARPLAPALPRPSPGRRSTSCSTSAGASTSSPAPVTAHRHERAA